MSNASILIVDDDPNICFILERTLGHEGYDLDFANDGVQAITKIQQNSYDLLLLDLQLGQVSGIQVFNALNEYNQGLVVIILTAHGSMESAVEALRLGAFDYLFKPALPEMIRQRVREGLEHHRQIQHKNQLLAQMNRLRQMLLEFENEEISTSPAFTEGRFVHSGELIIDRHHRSATLADRLLNLTTTEFNFLLCLAETAPQPVSCRQLVCLALDYDCEEMEARNIAKWHIHNIRQKIEPHPAQPRYIKNIRHKGYMWSSE